MTVITERGFYMEIEDADSNVSQPIPLRRLEIQRDFMYPTEQYNRPPEHGLLKMGFLTDFHQWRSIYGIIEVAWGFRAMYKVTVKYGMGHEIRSYNAFHDCFMMGYSTSEQNNELIDVDMEWRFGWSDTQLEPPEELRAAPRPVWLNRLPTLGAPFAEWDSPEFAWSCPTTAKIDWRSAGF
jgi:hypothetical protein